MLEDVNSDKRVYRCIVLISKVKYSVRFPERKVFHDELWRCHQ